MTARVLLATTLPLLFGCASTREYTLPSHDPIPPDRVLSVTMTDGRQIDFDDPGAVWLGSEKLSGYVTGEATVVDVADVSRLTLAEGPDRPSGSGSAPASTPDDSGNAAAIIGITAGVVAVAFLVACIASPSCFWK